MPGNFDSQLFWTLKVLPTQKDPLKISPRIVKFKLGPRKLLRFFRISDYPRKVWSDFEKFCRRLKNWLNLRNFSPATKLTRLRKVLTWIRKITLESENCHRKNSDFTRALEIYSPPRPKPEKARRRLKEKIFRNIQHPAKLQKIWTDFGKSRGVARPWTNLALLQLISSEIKKFLTWPKQFSYFPNNFQEIKKNSRYIKNPRKWINHVGSWTLPQDVQKPGWSQKKSF